MEFLFSMSGAETFSFEVGGSVPPSPPEPPQPSEPKTYGKAQYNFLGKITSLRGRGNFTEEDN